MTQSLPPPIPSLIPETAPFSEEQRVWLNGFFAGLVSLDGFGVTPLSGEQAAALLSGGASGQGADDDDGGAPWRSRIAVSAATTAKIIRVPFTPARKSG
jgi:sulfite reductase (NADPH) flavoprotein alpha-component